MSINTYPKKTLNELFGLEHQFQWPNDIDVIPTDELLEFVPSPGFKGMKHTDETKEKLKQISTKNKSYLHFPCQKGKNNSMYGKKHTEEAKKKISEIQKRRWNK